MMICSFCSTNREIVGIEPLKEYEIRSLRCPSCHTSVRLVFKRKQVRMRASRKDVAGAGIMMARLGRDALRLEEAPPLQPNVS